MINCVFCDFVTGKDRTASIVYRDDIVLAIMATGPANPGHLLITPTEHIERLAQMSEETGMHMFRIAMRLHRAIEKSGIKCEGTYLDLAEGTGAFRIVPHIYMDLVPRFRRDPYYVRAMIDRPYDDPEALLRRLAEDRIRRWRGEAPREYEDQDSPEALDELAAKIRDSYSAIWGRST